jgi:uncharacterized membrane protein
MLFMQTGKIDVWNKIKSRQAEMDRDDAVEMRKLKEEEKRQKAKDKEMQELTMVIGACAFVLFFVFVGVYEMVEYCQTNRCGR